jgi:hypothetical protein
MNDDKSIETALLQGFVGFLFGVMLTCLTLIFQKADEENKRPRLVYSIEDLGRCRIKDSAGHPTETYKVVLRNNGYRDAERVTAAVVLEKGQHFAFEVDKSPSLRVEYGFDGNLIQLSCETLNPGERIEVWIYRCEPRGDESWPDVSLRAKGENATWVRAHSE